MAKAPRADALRNRQRVLDTAKEVFATEGSSAGLLDIAARAGVGAGTVHRHFPTKEALYAAVISARLTELLDRVPALPDDPPGARFGEFCRLAVEQARVNADLCEVVTDTGQRPRLEPEVRARYLSTVDELAARARESGLLRADLTTADILALLSAAAMAEVREHDAEPGKLAELVVVSVFTPPASA